MKDSIIVKLDELKERLEEVSHLLSDPSIISNNNKFRELSQEYAHLDPVVAEFNAWKANESAIQDVKDIFNGSDSELKELAKEELPLLSESRRTEEHVPVTGARSGSGSLSSATERKTETAVCLTRKRFSARKSAMQS